MGTAARARAELAALLVRRHLREINYSYGAARPADVLAALVAGLAPNRGHDPVAALERAFAARIGMPHATAFASGRGALYAILRALGVGPGDEVIVPGFTCLVVPAAVIFAGAVPRFADIDQRTFNVDPASLADQVGSRTRVVVAQHTFGAPADLAAFRRAAPSAAIVEDCAHSSGAAVHGTRLGAAGDAAFFSLELTKPISAGSGGVAVTGRADIAAALVAEQRAGATVSRARRASAGARVAASWLLYHPRAYAVGKFALAALYKTGILDISITQASGAASGRPGIRPG